MNIKSIVVRRTLRGWLYRKQHNRCWRCGRTLTDTEKEYYENSCERCERIMLGVLKD